MLRFVLKFLGGRVFRSSTRWLLPTVAMLLGRVFKGLFSKKELVDLSKSKPGDRFVIEHLSETHGEQLARVKREKKLAKRAKKDAKRQ